MNQICSLWLQHLVINLSFLLHVRISNLRCKSFLYVQHVIHTTRWNGSAGSRRTVRRGLRRGPRVPGVSKTTVSGRTPAALGSLMTVAAARGVKRGRGGALEGLRSLAASNDPLPRRHLGHSVQGEIWQVQAVDVPRHHAGQSVHGFLYTSLLTCRPWDQVKRKRLKQCGSWFGQSGTKFIALSWTNLHLLWFFAFDTTSPTCSMFNEWAQNRIFDLLI